MQWNDRRLSTLRSRVQIAVGSVPHVTERAILFGSMGFLLGLSLDHDLGIPTTTAPFTHSTYMKPMRKTGVVDTCSSSRMT
jgi:hypothetical protein